MAIQSNFSLDKALTSQLYAYQCWYNYKYGGNTMGISRENMNEVTANWSSELLNWQANAENDENKYEIEDDDFYSAKTNGTQTAKDATGGFQPHTGAQITNGVASGVLAAGSAVGAIAPKVVTGLAKSIVGKAVNNATKNIGKNFLKKASKKTAEKIAQEAAEDTTGKSAEEIAGKKTLGARLTVILAAANVAKYLAAKPNKTEKKACDELQNVMLDSQNALSCAQEDMTTMQDELIELGDEANQVVEDGNESTEEDKAKFDLYKQSYIALTEKMQSGQELTEDEKALLEELGTLMKELGISIEETIGETRDIKTDIYDDMGTYQEGYDNAAETVAEVEGVTDYAESFDSTTRTMCYVEGASQGLNAASAASAAVKLSVGGPWNWAFAAIGYAAAAASGIAAKEQVTWASQVGTEIDMRETTQDINTDTQAIYDEQIDNYECQMATIEELEPIEPAEEEMEFPEAETTTTSNTQAQSGGFGVSTPEKEDEKKDKNKDGN